MLYNPALYNNNTPRSYERAELCWGQKTSEALPMSFRWSDLRIRTISYTLTNPDISLIWIFRQFFGTFVNFSLTLGTFSIPVTSLQLSSMHFENIFRNCLGVRINSTLNTWDSSCCKFIKKIMHLGIYYGYKLLNYNFNCVFCGLFACLFCTVNWENEKCVNLSRSTMLRKFSHNLICVYFCGQCCTLRTYTIFWGRKHADACMYISYLYVYFL